MELKTTKRPDDGQAIKFENGRLEVPDRPIIPFIEGDGTGPDIWKAAVRVFDAAVEKAYKGKRKVSWMEAYAGEKPYKMGLGWLPDETIEIFKHYYIGIKGPLTTPVGGGIRSLNVALRQQLDLFACVRPVRYFSGVPSPVKHPELVNMVIFRENTEDIYAGIEWMANTPEAKKIKDFLIKDMNVKKIRFPESSSIGIKPISEEGTKRLVRSAIDYAIAHNRKTVTIVHKGNIMKFTEGAFRDWGYEVALEPNYRGKVVTQMEAWILENKEKNPSLTNVENAKMVEPWFDQLDDSKQRSILNLVEKTLSLKETHGNGKWKHLVLLNDNIADITLQQVLTRPENFDIIATMNLNGDYISDALAAQVGGIGIAPGGNINYITGHAIFEATHGTAPKYANQDKVNPSSVILSGVMMFEHLGWQEVASMIVDSIDKTIGQHIVTYDFARLMKADGLKDVKEVKCSEFAEALINNM